MSRRADLGKARWIARVITRARVYLGEGIDLDVAVALAMGMVSGDASAGLVGGIGPRTIRAALISWDAWTAEVADYLRRRPVATIMQTGTAS